MSRPSRSALLAGIATIVALCSIVAPAPASAAPTAVSRPVTGDITGDRRADRVTLGADVATVPVACSARVQPGRAGGGFDAGTFRPLPVRGLMVLACPDLVAVVAGPRPGLARLAVSWSSVAPTGGRTVQFFTWSAGRWTYDGGFDGQVQPSTLTSLDVDGDRYGDIVQTTDQGSGVSVYRGRASSYTAVWSSSPSTSDTFAFADFDHGPGTDLVDAHSFFGALHVGVTVVDGATGRTVVLVSDDSASPASYLPEVVDVDRDGWLDVRVRVTSADGTALPTKVFRNRATGRLAFTGT